MNTVARSVSSDSARTTFWGAAGRRWLGVAVTSILAFSVTACAAEAKPVEQARELAIADLKPGLDPQPLDERVTLTAAISGNGEAYSALTLAAAMGEFEKENLDVQIEVVTPASTIFALMAQDRVDFAVTAAFAGMYNQVAAGSNIKMVTGGGEVSPESPTGWWQRVDEDGEVTCELKGATIGISTGAEANPLAASLARYLGGCGLTFDDVTLVELTHPEAVQALQNNAVQAAAVGHPFSVALAEDDAFELAARWDTGMAGTLMGNLLEERPAVAQAVVRAMLRTVQTYLQANYLEDPEVVAALVDILGVEESVLVAGIPRIYDPRFAPSAQTVEGIETFWLARGGILDYTDAVADKMTDESLIESILG